MTKDEENNLHKRLEYYQTEWARFSGRIAIEEYVKDVKLLLADINERQHRWMAHRGDINASVDEIAALKADLAARDARIRELEQQCATETRRRVELEGSVQVQQEERDALEQQLKAAQERLAEADSLLYRWKESRPTTVEREEVAVATAEYFAKHSPSSATPCALTGCTDTSWPHSHALRQP